MKKLLLLFLIMFFLIPLWGCFKQVPPEEHVGTSSASIALTQAPIITMEQATSLYQDFLVCERGAIWDDEDEIYSDFVFEGNERDRYAFFDMNGDGVPELHTNSDRGYYIFTCSNDGMIVWACHNSGGPLNNGATLSERDSSDTGTEYTYIEYDFFGNEQLRIEFGKYHARFFNGEKIYDESSDYIFEGEQVSKEQWDALTEPYFSIGSDKIEWIDAEPSHS